MPRDNQGSYIFEMYILCGSQHLWYVPYVNSYWISLLLAVNCFAVHPIFFRQLLLGTCK